MSPLYPLLLQIKSVCHSQWLFSLISRECHKRKISYPETLKQALYGQGETGSVTIKTQTMAPPIQTTTIESKSLVTFFLIAFIFTWLFWMPDALSKMGIIPASPLTGLGFLGAFGPLIAAITLTAIHEKKAGLVALFRRAIDHHFKKQWWFSIILLFPALVILAFLLAVTTEGAVPSSQVFSEPWILFPAFFSVLFLSGPFEEEFGWRGYALPRLQAKFSALSSSLILGFIWAIWHIPQFLIPNNGMFYKTPIWTFIPTVIAATILFTWVYNNTHGSLLSMLLLHTTFNLSMFTFPVLDTNFGFLYVLGVFSIVALLVTVMFNPLEFRRNASSNPDESGQYQHDSNLHESTT